MTAVRTLIAEDEPLARRTLREMIAEVPWLDLAGEAENGATAVRLIDDLLPDLVFLDVQMPERTGLEVLDTIHHQPAVVFTTAFDVYAVAAFELGALDYLVKPFGRARFGTAVERVRRQLTHGASPVTAAERMRMGSRDRLERIFARRGPTIVPCPVNTIVRIEAREDYVRVYAEHEAFVLSIALGDLTERLDASRFLRVHRSHVVNLDFVAAIERHDDRRLAIRLRDGSTVVASRAGSQALRQLVL